MDMLDWTRGSSSRLNLMAGTEADAERSTMHIENLVELVAAQLPRQAGS